ncbi:phage portal protein [Kistimonas scapharcae]|uniref:Phage portal protein n=1 Tax=Kistimonas scapharcae TaxID=1036133 RepID=A0ABP8V0C1_9GAMM
MTDNALMKLPEKRTGKMVVESFKFGEPEPVLGGRILDYLGTFTDIGGRYYEPPVNMAGLSRMRFANAHHGSCLFFKRNILSRYFQPSTAISLRDFRAAALDYGVFGNAYFKMIQTYGGMVSRLVHLPALNMRRMKKKNRYAMLKPGLSHDLVEFDEGEVLHVAEYDTTQQIYGIPEWLCAMQAILLNEDATLFRRRYFQNGSHLGYILYTSDEQIDPETEKALTEQIANGKGAGNFRSMYINIPGGKEKAVQLIPVGDISQKDEFERIKNISADDVVVAHRVPPALAGIKPDNNGGFGDIEKIKGVYVETEVMPMAQPFEDLNSQLPARAQFTFNFPAMDAA